LFIRELPLRLMRSFPMQPPLSRTEGKLPSVRIIGFTGHRHLKNPEAVAAALKSELAALQKAGGELIAVSSIAIGSDTLFAEEVIRAGIKWIAILPMPRELFREDFTAEEWARAERLIGQAAEVRVLRGTERPQVYVDGGKETVDNSDCLFAVWDGKPAHGPGGTAEIVAYAKMLGRKITLFREGEAGVEKIDPSLAPSAENRPEDLLRAMGPPASLPPPPQSLLDHFKTCDDVATRTAPNFRRSTLQMARFHLAATLVAGLSLSLHAHHLTSSTSTNMLGALKVVCVFFALVILGSLRWTHTHEIWLRRRLAAEYCRSILATWHCRDPVEPVSFHEVPELRDLAQSALFLRLEKDRRALVDAMAFRAAYAHDRIRKQLDYFRREGDAAQAKEGPLRTRYWTYTVFAFIFCVLLFWLRFLSPQFASDNFASSSLITQGFVTFLDIFPLALPALASFTLACLAIEDVDRRIRRFRDLQNKMRIALVDLSYCGSWDSLCRSVERTEKILFNEVLEWYSISRYSATN
jgi:hypothetical protein